MNIDDTIVAVSSPPGAGERGIVRLAGPRAIEIADCLFTAAGAGCGIADSGGEAAVRRSGRIVFDEGWLDATVFVFPCGTSYTGQPTVELHLIGSPVVLGMLVEAAIARGARRAEAGEFTARAFFSGRIDLSQAHGVAGMIAAQSDRQLRAAERLLHGALGRVALEAREELADLLSLVEGAMDFADEPIEFITAADLRARVEAVRSRLRATANAGLRAERWGRLPRVVMAGRPNAGKSTLLNRLCGAERAISTPIAGTTRDAISVEVDLGDSSCVLVDVAGRRHDDRTTSTAGSNVDAIDAQADRVAVEAAGDADVLLIVVDMAGGGWPADIAPSIVSIDAPRIVVGNKSDIATESNADSLRAWGGAMLGCDMISVSAATGAGCGALRRRIGTHLSDRETPGDESTVALMAEHREALEAALSAIDRAAAAAAATASACDAELRDADLVAAELRIAAASLGALVGMDQTEEMLGRIFSRFCVGK